jgi:phage gp46-like protein
MSEHQGDVLLFQRNDGGEIEVINGAVTLSGGLETAAYLCLFGGNEDDDGRIDNPLQYWGNYLENEEPKKYRSETQHLLRSIAAIPFNLRRIEEAAVRDLEPLIDAGAASEVSVAASIPGVNEVKIVVDIVANGLPETFTFYENWIFDAS